VLWALTAHPTDMDFSEAELADWDVQRRFQLRLTSARIASRFIQGPAVEGHWASMMKPCWPFGRLFASGSRGDLVRGAAQGGSGPIM